MQSDDDSKDNGAQPVDLDAALEDEIHEVVAAVTHEPTTVYAAEEKLPTAWTAAGKLDEWSEWSVLKQMVSLRWFGVDRWGDDGPYLEGPVPVGSSCTVCGRMIMVRDAGMTVSIIEHSGENDGAQTDWSAHRACVERKTGLLTQLQLERAHPAIVSDGIVSAAIERWQRTGEGGTSE